MTFEKYAISGNLNAISILQHSHCFNIYMYSLKKKIIYNYLFTLSFPLSPHLPVHYWSR